MKLTKLCYIMAAVMAAGLVYNASAWPDYRWTGLGGDDLWNNPLNWTNLTTFNVDLPEDEATTLSAVQIDQANGSTNCIIPAGYTVDLDSANPTAIYNTIFGPEFGMRLSIYGTLKYAWMMAPVQNNPAPGARSIINMYTNSVLYTAGAGVGIGDAWWWYTAAPFVTLNMYGNAQLTAPNIALGGHLNIYDTATATATVAVFTGNGSANTGGYTSSGACSDPTASLVLGGGTLILPSAFTNETSEAGNTVNDLVRRGVLRPYGILGASNDLVVSTVDTTNISVTTVPLGGSLQQIYMEPLCRSTMEVGAFQQIALAGNYPSVSGVLVGTPEPGVDPASLPGTISYTSSNPSVATVDASGMVRAIAPGTATLSATLGVLTSTNTLTVTVVPGTATLVHRYSFNETSGTTAADSVGGSAWDGTLEGAGTAFSNGSVVFTGATNNMILGDGMASYVSLPPGIVSNMNEITIETWATIDATTTNNYENLFAFGTEDLDPGDATVGEGGYYITFSPHTGASPATSSLNFGQGLPGNAAEVDAVNGSVLDGQTNIQIVGVYSPDTGTESLYTNGVLAVSTTYLWNAMTDPAAFNGPAINKGSILSATLGADPVNYLGESLYMADPGFKGSINEFRIYNGALTASQIAADNALGPNQLRGTNTSDVSLSATQSSGKLTFTWPTSSALVTLESSPTLGPNATWTPVAMPAQALTASGGNYHFTTPMSGTAEFYRLSE